MNTAQGAATGDWFRRFILPGFAFKALVIGGGYATGRELAEFFLPYGSGGGLLGMLVAALVWSVMCALTFSFAWATHSYDYRAFFRHLLGPAWWTFEILFIATLIIVLAVFGAAAGAIGAALFDLPPIVGTLLLVLSISGFAAFGNELVESLFKYVSFLLYGVYALFLVLALWRFGDRIEVTYARPSISDGWLVSGILYASYNLTGAIGILPVVRHMRSERDAITAGILAGPLAMIPAAVFFICMASWPDSLGAVLPSDFLLEKLDLPAMRFLYQATIFAALLESGCGTLHAFNERLAGAFGGPNHHLPWQYRLAISLVVLTMAVFLADRIGLVGLIASGYRFISYGYLAVFIVPLVIVGGARVVRSMVQPNPAQ